MIRRIAGSRTLRLWLTGRRGLQRSTVEPWVGRRAGDFRGRAHAFNPTIHLCGQSISSLIRWKPAQSEGILS